MLAAASQLKLSTEQALEVIAALDGCQMGPTTQAHFKQTAEEGSQSSYEYAAKVGAGIEKLILLADLTLLAPADHPELEPLLAAARARLAELSRRFALVPQDFTTPTRPRLSELAERRTT
jgi:hypothetical protein